MAKIIENKECRVCESKYKLVYDLDETSGYPKFCPFCGSEIYDDEDLEEDMFEEEE